MLVLLALVAAQGTAADYARAERAPREWPGLVDRAPASVRWTADGRTLWYRVDSSGGRRDWVLADAATGAKEPLFDRAKLAAALKADAERLPVERTELTPDRAAVFFSREQRRFRWDRRSHTLEAVERLPPAPRAPEPTPRPRRRPPGRSPDGKWVAFFRTTTSTCARSPREWSYRCPKTARRETAMGAIGGGHPIRGISP